MLVLSIERAFATALFVIKLALVSRRRSLGDRGAYELEQFFGVDERVVFELDTQPSGVTPDPADHGAGEAEASRPAVAAPTGWICQQIDFPGWSGVRKRILRCAAVSYQPAPNTITEDPDPSVSDRDTSDENEETQEDESVNPFDDQSG